MSRIDSKFAALREHGFTGAVSDMTLQWLQANGATSNQISDAWLEMLAAQGYTDGQRNDLWFRFLGDRGYEGAYPDRDDAFWADGGNIGPPGEEYFHDFTTGDIGNWNHTRGSIATAPDADGIIQHYTGDEPAFYRDQGLQLEAASENKCQEYIINTDTDWWTRTGIAGTDEFHPTITAPDGTLTARHVQEGTNFYISADDGGMVNGDTLSIYARAMPGESGTIHLLRHNTVAACLFDITDEWQRFEFTNDGSGTLPTWMYAIDFRNTAATLDECLIWGGQADSLTGFATSLIPTSGAPVTRNETLCQATFAELGAPLPASGFVNDFCGQLTHVWAHDAAEAPGFVAIIELATDTLGNSVDIVISNSDDRLFLRKWAGGSNIGEIATPAGSIDYVKGDSADIRFKVSSTEGMTIWVNGDRYNTSIRTEPVLEPLYICSLGRAPLRTGPANLIASTARIVPTALSDAEIEGWPGVPIEYFHDFTTGEIGEWNHTRGSIATAPDPDGIIQTYTGDEPAFYRDHGLQLEAASANHLSDSDIGPLGVGWIARGAVWIGSAEAPDGSNNAAAIQVYDGAAADLYWVKLRGTAGERAEPSVWVKYYSGPDFNIRHSTGDPNGAWTVDVSLLSGEWEKIDRSHPAVSITNEFVIAPDGNASIHFRHFDTEPTRLDVFGAQIELSELPSSLIPNNTETEVVDRNDTNCQATFAELGAPLPAGGVVNDFCGQITFIIPHHDLTGSVNSGRYLQITEVPVLNNNSIRVDEAGDGLAIRKTVGNVNVAQPVHAVDIPAGQDVDIRFKQSSTEGFTTWVNGDRINISSTTESFDEPLSAVTLGSPFGTNHFNVVSTFRLVPTALSDEEIEGWS